MSHKKLYFIGLFFVVIFSIAFALFSKRDEILLSLLQNHIEKFEHRSNADLSFESASMDGFRRLVIHNVRLLSPNQDTLLTVRKTDVTFKLSNLFRLNANVECLGIEGAKVFYNAPDGSNNFSFLFASSGSSSTQSSHSSKIESFVKLYKQFLDFVPESMHVSDILIIGYRHENLCRFFFPETTLMDGILESQVIYRLSYPSGQYVEKSFVITGDLNQPDTELSSLRLYPVTPQSMPIALHRGEEVFSFSFDTLNFCFSSDKRCENWNGNISFSDLSLSNDRLASVPVFLDSFSLNYRMSIFLEPFLKVELDSCSSLKINGFSLNPYILYEKKDSLPHVHVEVNRDSFLAQSLFDALPTGLFSNLEGIRTKGALSYHFLFDLDLNKIDSLSFSSSLNKLDFSIEKFGETDFTSVNQPFTYYAYDNGLEDTHFLVGDKNPDFTPLEDISTYLRHSILYSEDGLFFYHKGFLETAMNAAIVKDVKEKRFARGGSTISMQLVKNLWLSREKTLSRKLEEAMIVWLVENNRLISKNRMYEIYLNIIEWGPHIYGVKQASHFYFSKEPSELTPEESIFMASIIPRPKKFMWFFDQNQELKPFLIGYFDLLGDKLLKHDIISQEQRESLAHDVKLVGAARVYLRTPVAKMSSSVNGEADDESVLMESLDKPREDDENISNESDKEN